VPRQRTLLAAGVVALLVIGGCRKKTATPANLNAANAVSIRAVTIYFEGPDMLLGPEVREIPLPANEAGAIPIVMRELLKGSPNVNLARPLPADSILRAAYLLPDGNAIIDLGGPTLSNGWGTGSHGELMGVYSIVQTVASNFPAVRRVRILINGEPAETLAGHVSLARSLAPLPSVVRR
jgi:spore germination protein GerM